MNHKLEWCLSGDTVILIGLICAQHALSEELYMIYFVLIGFQLEPHLYNVLIQFVAVF